MTVSGAVLFKANTIYGIGDLNNRSLWLVRNNSVGFI